MHGDEPSQYREIDAAELGKSFDPCSGAYIWVDVRTMEEYDSGHIPGSLHIPHDEVEARWRELEKYRDRKLALVCQRGGRSLYAVKVLSSLDFPFLYNVTGGMEAWTGPIIATN
ncbi:rhodanese-like domain-containing protein [Pasteuria penetrans]|uniref:rhodanese-like domain-containing protein n=1 Tax=Pasteuria penetrans TaxID=86005 RepID=UPI001CAA74D7|nr:rhodanese-like domain-containing protein [Pasteuria penetrans]